MQNYIVYTALVYWSVTAQAAARLSAPVITVILSYFFLKEFASRSELLFLFLTLGSAILVVLGAPQSAEDKAKIESLGSASFIAYIFLIGEPFGNAVA